jgi:hypothetical protein
MKCSGVAVRCLLSVCLLAKAVYGIDCSNLPTQFSGNEFPSGNFFSNFANSCYTIPMSSGNGQTGDQGDLNALYNQIFYKVDTRYQLIIVGAFPNARYFSIALYDEHSALTQSVLDKNIAPLTSGYINPYTAGTAYVAGQRYALAIDFGGVAGTVETGCAMTGFNINMLDGTQRHASMDWNLDEGLFQAHPNFVLHVVDTPQHTNPNRGGVVLIRSYLDITPSGRQTNPFVIVRDVASGCAYPASYVMNTLQIVANDKSTGETWLDGAQGNAHTYYDKQYLPKLCFGTDPQNQLTWMRQTEYEPGNNPDASYIIATVPAGLVVNLAGAGQVMRLRVRVPQTPPTPCMNGCSLSGSEQMRYMSLSLISGAHTLASIADSGFTTDPNGYATLIVGTGAAIPSWITPANGYTFLDLTAAAGYQQLSLLSLRNILPASTFQCSGAIVPYRTGDYTPAGDLMGEYLPVVDYPAADSLPQVAAPLVQANSCGIFPDGQPATMPACAVLNSPPLNISSVTTQCPAPGCNQVVQQPQPPLTILGSGFGSFPGGLPYTGTSSFLSIIDTTQNWSAGYGSDTCIVTIYEWSDSKISLAANVNQNGVCPMAAGDLLMITVWNPQTLGSPAAYTVTVAGN